MIVSHVSLKNWRNFKIVDVPLQDRVFLVGPNASGKSNFLDVFRFLHDIAKPGGGLQKAIDDRGGVSRIRCLAARKNPDIEICVDLTDSAEDQHTWRYEIGITQESRGFRRAILRYERVYRDNKEVVSRPDRNDKQDVLRLTQTHLEQINANAKFREIERFLDAVQYLHLVPQLVRQPEAFSGPGIPGDPFGQSFLERVAKTQERTRKARLKNIQQALRLAVPQLSQLAYARDELGSPHLEVVYEHWRPHGARQREDQFSDGTLRLLGLLWSLLEGESLLLLEEPELSLHAGIVRRLPALIYRLQKTRKRQVLLSTHSTDILDDKGIVGEEVLLLTPSREGTTVNRASDIAEVKALMEGGLSVADAVVPRTSPANIEQLELFR